jgi:hypothetical protein
MVDVAGRFANRMQLSTDEHAAHLTAVPDAFGRAVDYVKAGRKPKVVNL